MDKKVSLHMHFIEEEGENDVTYFHKVSDYGKQYTIEGVIQQITASIEEIGRVPGKRMSIVVHVSKSIEEE